MGNRGGKFHRPGTSSLVGRPFANRQWICCRLSFKGRKREVWGRGYTELFFTDEVTALAAGHRPCFECRREDAVAFAQAWGRAHGVEPPRASQMDDILHSERLTGERSYTKRLHPAKARDLPDGAMLVHESRPCAVLDGKLCLWTFAGFLPTKTALPSGDVMILTPPSILAVLRAGYRSRSAWHR